MASLNQLHEEDSKEKKHSAGVSLDDADHEKVTNHFISEEGMRERTKRLAAQAAAEAEAEAERERALQAELLARAPTPPAGDRKMDTSGKSFSRKSSSSLNLEAMDSKPISGKIVRDINRLNLISENLPLLEKEHSKTMSVRTVRKFNQVQLIHDILEDLELPFPRPRESKEENVFKLQIASDLHIEMFSRDKFRPKSTLFDEVIRPRAPYLALLGDIGCPANSESDWEDYKNFLLLQAERFKRVYILAGNHEYYIGSFGAKKLTAPEVKARIQSLCDSHPRLMFLDKRSEVVEEGKVRVVGTTLWSYIPPKSRKSVESGVNDYHLCYMPDPTSEDGVRLLSSEDTVSWHEEELEYIKAEARAAKAAGQRMVVLSHHPPTFTDTSNPMYRTSPIRWAFSTDLEYMFNYNGEHGPDTEFSAIHTWACGHTHWSCDQTINGVHIVSNQYGYTGTAECTYKPGFVVSV